VTYTVEPRNLAELAVVQEAITEFVKTDPALEFETNPETGEMLLSGAGELHVEVSVEKLTRRGIQINLGKPMVLIKEQMTEDGEACESGDPPSSTFRVKAIPLQEDTDIPSFGNILDSDIQSQCYLIDATNSINPLNENTEWMKEAFTAVIRSGPVRGERMRMLAVVIQKATIRIESPENSWRDITQPLVNSMRESILSGNPVVLEPWVRLELSTPEDHVGALSSIIARRKGHILEIDSERSFFKITAEIPVRSSFGLANEIRTTTSGWASWGAKAGEYREF